MSKSSARSKGHKKKRIKAGTGKYWKESGFVCLASSDPDKSLILWRRNPQATLFQVYSVESILVEEGKHHIRTGDSPPEIEDTIDMVGSRIRQVQQLQQIADTVCTELNGVKNSGRIKSRAQLFLPVEEPKQIRAPIYSKQLVTT
jgi:hypothetical protein